MSLEELNQKKKEQNTEPAKFSKGMAGQAARSTANVSASATILGFDQFFTPLKLKKKQFLWMGPMANCHQSPIYDKIINN